MKKLAGLAAAAAIVGTLGCYSAPVMPPPGMVFADIKAPLDYDQEASSVSNSSGSAESLSILGLVALGDCSINTAANNGGLSTLHGADYEYFNVIGVYQTFTTVVYGD